MNNKIERARAEYLLALEENQMQLHEKIDHLHEKIDKILNYKTSLVLLKRNEVAEMLKVSVSTLRTMESNKKLKPIRLTDNGDVYYRLSEVINLLEKDSQNAAGSPRPQYPGQRALKLRKLSPEAVCVSHGA